MTSLRSVGELIDNTPFSTGVYEVACLSEMEGASPLVRLSFDSDDGPAVRNVPHVALAMAADGGSRRQGRALAALGRAGVRLAGLRDDDLLAVHRLARIDHHVELFADLCAISTGLLQALVRSLGRCLSRVVVSSSTIDVLHEYQGPMTRRVTDEFLRRNEMMRVLRVLEEIRRDVPVHVHQLAPGASRYFHRTRGGPSFDPESGAEEQAPATYVSEDRQMIAAFWDYIATSNPRLPIKLVTSDHRLAHVCVAERAPYLFAPALAEIVKREPATPLETLWFDPSALALRAVTAHEILWELSFSFSRINIQRIGSANDGFSLSYDRDLHPPGAPEIVAKGPLLATMRPAEVPLRAGTEPKGRSGRRGASAGSSRSGAHPDSPGREPPTGAEPADRTVKVALTRMLEVLPTRPGQRIPLSKYRPTDEDSLRQLRYVGEVTRLFQFEGEAVVAGPALEDLLAALKGRDYVAVNALFRKYPRYDGVLSAAAEGAPFPKGAGALTGWAIVLGAAYKTAEGVHFGLQAVTDADFDRAVERAHKDLGRGIAAVPLARILDHVCREKRLSPIRFEAMLDSALGKGILQHYEAQRTTHQEPIPPHTVLVEPPSADPTGYQRQMEPGRGIIIRGKLMGSLVRRDGGS